MSVILVDHPQLMMTWKEFSLVVNVVHSFVFLKLVTMYCVYIVTVFFREFINIGVTYLTKNNDDTSFCIDFLQPLTDKYLTASVNKKTRNNFSFDNKTLVDDVSTSVISYIISLFNREQHLYHF